MDRHSRLFLGHGPPIGGDHIGHLLGQARPAGLENPRLFLATSDKITLSLAHLDARRLLDVSLLDRHHFISLILEGFTSAANAFQRVPLCRQPGVRITFASLHPSPVRTWFTQEDGAMQHSAESPVLCRLLHASGSR